MQCVFGNHGTTIILSHLSTVTGNIYIHRHKYVYKYEAVEFAPTFLLWYSILLASAYRLVMNSEVSWFFVDVVTLIYQHCLTNGYFSTSNQTCFSYIYVGKLLLSLADKGIWIKWLMAGYQSHVIFMYELLWLCIFWGMHFNIIWCPMWA